MTQALRRTLVTFWIETKLFALDVLDVQEVTPVLEVTPLPGAPRSVAGVVTWRGASVPVLDLREQDSSPDPSGVRGPIVVLRRPERFGVLVDRADGIRRMEPAALEREHVTCLDAKSLLTRGFGRTA
jgi:chemotaxis signal transduction protein